MQNLASIFLAFQSKSCRILLNFIFCIHSFHRHLTVLKSTSPRKTDLNFLLSPFHDFSNPTGETVKGRKTLQVHTKALNLKRLSVCDTSERTCTNTVTFPSKRPDVFSKRRRVLNGRPSISERTAVKIHFDRGVLEFVLIS